MKYTFKKAEELTCRDMENRLGLNKGDIKELTIHPDGKVEMEVSDTIATSLDTETQALAKVDELIDGISNLAGAKVFLKRLVARLIKKGLLP